MAHTHRHDPKRRALLKKGMLVLSSGLVGQFILPALPGAASPEAQSGKKRIYIAADDHTDYFWTAGEAQYRDAFLAMIDYYLDQADKTVSNPSNYQSRWNCDGSFWLWVYEKNRTTAQFQRLIDRVKSGHISFPMTPLVLVVGGAPAEAVLRGLYYAGSLERRFNLRVPLAVAMENQTLPLGLGMLWAGAGAKYSWRGICGCDTLVSGANRRPKEIYWWQGLDGSRILMKWNSMPLSNQEIGGYAEAWNPANTVEFVDNDTQFKSRYPYTVIGAFGKGWDGLQVLTQEFVDTAKAKSNASRDVIVSNEEDFFKDFEVTYGAQLGQLTASFGNEWDLYAACLAELTAGVKRSVEKLRAAEALAAIVSLKTPAFMDGRQAARAQAFMNMGLFWEHNFGMVGPLPWDPNPVQKRLEWDRRVAGEIKSYVDLLQADAAQALGAMIAKTGANERFFAFNPLGWTRTGAADYPYPGAGPVHVIDLLDGKETPSQLLTIDGVQYLRVLATRVPPVGYKVFEVQPGAGQDFAPAVSVNGGVMENTAYRITVTGRGAITSWVDKARGNREMVRASTGRAVNDLGPGSGSLVLESSGPVSATLLATSSTPLAHQTRITLYRATARIEIRNEITQNFNSTATWGFGLEINSPDTWHEEIGAILRAKLTTGGGHYFADPAYPNAARYDWLTLNHFADMSGGSVGVTLSNADCAFMKLGNSSVSSLDTATPLISALAGGRVANGENGIPAQGGDTRFTQRFALQTHGAYSPPAAMMFALEHQNPLVTGKVTGGSLMPEKDFSLISISNPSVLLWALKPADDGPAAGLVARVWNVSSGAVNFNLSIPGGQVKSAQQVTHIETPTGSAPVLNATLTGTLAAQQMKSYALQVDINAPRLPKCRVIDGVFCEYIPAVHDYSTRYALQASEQWRRKQKIFS